MFDNAKHAFTGAVNTQWPILSDKMKQLTNLDAERERVLAAIRGGCKDFGSERDVEASYSERRVSVADAAMAYVDKLRAGFRDVLDATLAFDASEVADIAPALALKSLTDNDLRVLAKRNRNGRGALMAIVERGADAKYGSTLGVALDHYRQTLYSACTKAADSCERALSGQGITDHAKLRSRIDEQSEAIDEAWSQLQDAIDGTPAIDPMEATLRRLALRG